MKDNCFTILCWFSAIHQHEMQTQRTDLLGFLNSLLSIFFLLPFSSSYIYIFDALTPGVLLIMERLPSQGQPIFRNSTGLQVLPSNAHQEIQAHNFNFLCYRDLILQIIIFSPNHLRGSFQTTRDLPYIVTEIAQTSQSNTCTPCIVIFFLRRNHNHSSSREL